MGRASDNVHMQQQSLSRATPPLLPLGKLTNLQPNTEYDFVGVLVATSRPVHYLAVAGSGHATGTPCVQQKLLLADPKSHKLMPGTMWMLMVTLQGPVSIVNLLPVSDCSTYDEGADGAGVTGLDLDLADPVGHVDPDPTRTEPAGDPTSMVQEVEDWEGVEVGEDGLQCRDSKRVKRTDNNGTEIEATVSGVATAAKAAAAAAAAAAAVIIEAAAVFLPIPATAATESIFVMKGLLHTNTCGKLSLFCARLSPDMAPLRGITAAAAMVNGRRRSAGFGGGVGGRLGSGDGKGLWGDVGEAQSGVAAWLVHEAGWHVLARCRRAIKKKGGLDPF